MEVATIWAKQIILGNFKLRQVPRYYYKLVCAILVHWGYGFVVEAANKGK